MGHGKQGSYFVTSQSLSNTRVGISDTKTYMDVPRLVGITVLLSAVMLHATQVRAVKVGRAAGEFERDYEEFVVFGRTPQVVKTRS